MPKKFICNLSTEELQRIYDEAGTVKAMCPIVGCKSDITMRKILHQRNIDTNKNAQRKRKTMLGLSDKEFELFLRNEYEMLSMDEIARELGVSHNIIRRHFAKYGILSRKGSDRSPMRQMERENRIFKHDGDYSLLYRPEHPRNCSGYIREHVYVMEQHLGRYLEPGEVVHHIDCDKSNNDISNLVVLTNGQHLGVHNKIRAGMDKLQALKEVVENAQ